MDTAPINIFQKLMRKWEGVHPYNAVHVMKISGVPDRETWQTAWREALASLELGKLSVDEDRYGFDAIRDPVVEFDPQDLLTHVNEELNHWFTDDEPPFRAFVINGDGHFHAGVSYRHWIADATAVRELLREWFVRVFDPQAARRTPMRLPQHGYWHTIGPHRVGWRVMESSLAMFRRHTRFRRVQKIASTELENHHTRFVPIETPDDLLPRMKRFASAKGVKINDLFLAALMEACSIHVPLQRRPSRTDVAVGSIVDLRQFCPDDLSNTFGAFLGFTNVVARPADVGDFDRLLRVISNQTRLQKRTGIAPASLIWMSAATAIGKLSRPDELYHFYRKELPLAGGISNVDLSQTWAAKYYPTPLMGYFRASPSGPMTPLVIVVTTLGEKLNMGMTHRVGLIPPELAGAVAETILKRLSGPVAAKC